MAPGLDRSTAPVGFSPLGASMDAMLRSVASGSQERHEYRQSPMIKTEISNNIPTPNNSRLSVENQSLRLQLEGLRKQREALEIQAQEAELRAEIADEERRILQIQQRIKNAEQRECSEQSERLSHDSRGLKRKRSDSSSSELELQGLPEIQFEHLFSIDDDIYRLNNFLGYMEDVFKQFSEVYTNDRRKIRSAKKGLDRKNSMAWEDHVASRNGWEPSWHDFVTFFRERELDPEMVKKAISTLTNARQRRDQTVKEFAHFLARYQAYIQPLDMLQRKEELRARLNKKLKAESEKPCWSSVEPDEYSEFIAHLDNIQETLSLENPCY